jgi:hypothetical protein
VPSPMRSARTRPTSPSGGKSITAVSSCSTSDLGSCDSSASLSGFSGFSGFSPRFRFKLSGKDGRIAMQCAILVPACDRPDLSGSGLG